MDESPRPQLYIEGQRVSQSYNNVAIPGSNLRFSLKQVIGGGSWAGQRITVVLPRGERRGMRFVYAPLRLSGQSNDTAPIAFKDATFQGSPQSPLRGTYRFNSYRASFFKRDPKPGGELRYGVTLKVRDADIALSQGNLRRNEYNLGIVPLIYVGGERRFSKKLTGYLDFDGLAGGPGRAFDIGLQLGYRVSPDTDFLLGLRTLEGGADVREVYNFARVNYLSLGLMKRL
jgi:hypothetical protein